LRIKREKISLFIYIKKRKKKAWADKKISNVNILIAEGEKFTFNNV
jgi:hypothetical protein